MKIAILHHTTRNVGDDIQRLALEELLPRIDYRIDRDDMRPAENLDRDTKFIVNGWFSWRTHKVWPIRTGARVLYIGFHADNQGVIPENPELPVGCRDIWTYEHCLLKNTPAWLSWCVTLTLRRSIPKNRENVFFVDLPPAIVETIPEPIRRSARNLTHVIAKNGDRDAEAKTRLDLYATARLVVTSRLHVALPCVAMGIPVVLAPPSYHAYRFASYLDLAWSPENAPWFEMRPRVTTERIMGMAMTFRKMLDSFLDL